MIAGRSRWRRLRLTAVCAFRPFGIAGLRAPLAYHGKDARRRLRPPPPGVWAYVFQGLKREYEWLTLVPRTV